MTATDAGPRARLSARTIPEALAERAARTPDKLAVVAEDARGGVLRLTYADVERESRRVAKALIASGVGKGDRVAIWAPNVWEWVTAYYGTQLAAATTVPVNTRFKGPEAAYVLAKSGASTLLTVTGFLGTDYLGWLEGAAAEQPTPALRRRVVLRGEVPEGAVGFEDFLRAGDAVSDAVLDERTASLGPDDRSDISFTSGTTGSPKGAVATQAQVCAPFGAWADVVGLRADDRIMIIAPFFHSFGSKAGLFTALLAGATVHPRLTFDPAGCLRLIENERITVVPGPPAIFHGLLADPARSAHDLSSLRLAVTGSSDVPTDLVLAMRGELGFEHVVTGYGLTESSGVATMCSHTDDPETVARTAGRAIPGVEVRIDGGGGAPAPTGTRGEILLRGYNVMSGYWRDPERSAEAFVDGWLRTGDIGELDDAGYLRVTGRSKDMYIRGGENVYPVEVEHALARHGDVREAAVIGVPDARFGEVGRAFVVPRPGAGLDAESLIAWARTRMANYKVPRYVTFLDELPKNASAKVFKPALRELARAAEADGGGRTDGGGTDGGADGGRGDGAGEGA
ncbi:AMP-binding protein [Actinomadura yumaensis]|uniref:AMP-binding protein n=2 Tax=Actinomadura yumaensis TaxID=111807 RepID=A0ABW2CDB8_9ACTN